MLLLSVPALMVPELSGPMIAGFLTFSALCAVIVAVTLHFQARDHGYAEEEDGEQSWMW